MQTIWSQCWQICSYEGPISEIGIWNDPNLGPETGSVGSGRGGRPGPRWCCTPRAAVPAPRSTAPIQARRGHRRGRRALVSAG
eukprot:13021333-Alexandrium_andersonii.AAC.1